MTDDDEGKAELSWEGSFTTAWLKKAGKRLNDGNVTVLRKETRGKIEGYVVRRSGQLNGREKKELWVPPAELTDIKTYRPGDVFPGAGDQCDRMDGALPAPAKTSEL